MISLTLTTQVRNSGRSSTNDGSVRATHLRHLAALRHAQFVLLRYVPALSPVDVAPPRHALDDAISSIELQFLERGGAEAHAAALSREIVDQRRELWVDFIRPIIRVAHERLARIADARNLPPGNRRAQLTSFLQHVFMVGDVVTQHEARFTRYGVPLDTGAKLRRMAHELAALAARRDGLDRYLADRRAATDVTIQRGRDAVAALGPFVENQFRGRPHILVVWRDAAELRGQLPRARYSNGVPTNVRYVPAEPIEIVKLALAKAGR